MIFFVYDHRRTGHFFSGGNHLPKKLTVTSKEHKENTGPHHLSYSVR